MMIDNIPSGMQEKCLVLKYLLEKEIRDMCAGFENIALQVSGGLDSAILFQLCKGIFGPDRVKTYCVSWGDEDWEYSRDARKAIGESHQLKVVTFSYDDMVATLPIIAKINPTACWSQVGQWFCNRQIAVDGIKVVLTGEAADELFGGYSRHKIMWWLEQMFSDPKLQAYIPMMNRVIGTKRDIFNRIKKPLPDKVDLVALTLSSNKLYQSLTTRLIRHDQAVLPLTIRAARQMANCHDLVNICPFNAKGIHDFASTLSDEYLLNKDYAKIILRVLAQSIGVPEEIINETTKKGFFIPQKWRPVGEKLWSTAWFDGLMKKATGSTPQDTASSR